MKDGAVDAAVPQAVQRRRALIACAIGNLFETFDFAVYGFLAIPIAATFFPSSDSNAALLSSFAAFAIGFFMRPVGALVLGSYADRLGRTKALVLTFALMSVATTLTCFLPGYETIGIAASIILVLFRMVQGFAVGGSTGAVTSFFMEYAPNDRRGMMGGLQAISTRLGAMMGSFVAGAVAWSVAPQAYMDWGWRLPFALGIIPLIVALYLHFNVPDTPAFTAAKAQEDKDRSPLLEVIREHRAALLVGAMVSIVGVVANFTFVVFLTSQAVSHLGISASSALFSSTAASALLIVGAPFAGRLSDSIGRKPLIIFTAAGFAFCGYPLYLLATNAHGSLTNLVIAQIGESILHCSYLAVLPTFLAELFPTRVRSIAISIAYGSVVAVFGGLTPFIALSLVDMSDNLAMPGIMVSVAGIASLVAILSIRGRGAAFM